MDAFNLQFETPSAPARHVWCPIKEKNMLDAQAAFGGYFSYNTIIPHNALKPNPIKHITWDFQPSQKTKFLTLTFDHVMSLLISISRKCTKVITFDPFARTVNRNVVIVLLERVTKQTVFFKIVTATLTKCKITNAHKLSNIHYTTNSKKQHQHPHDFISPYLEQILFQVGTISLNQKHYQID